MTQERVRKTRATKATKAAKAAEAGSQAGGTKAEEAKKVVELTDELLDEIDAVLEEDAETFVRAYVQKGGQ